MAVNLMRCFFILGLLLLYTTSDAEPLQVSVEAESAILINADTGAILYEKNCREKLYPASVTKIATAIYTLDRSGAKLDALCTADQESVGFVTENAKKRSNYTLPAHYLEFGATHIVIHKGEKLSLRDLLYAQMIHSADDASNVIAQHVGGTIPRFMGELNSYLQELGLKDTHLMNPHGLHHPDHYSTAYDLALLSVHALKNRQFREIVSTTQCVRPKTELQAAATLVQTNRLLRKGEYYYPKAIGVKTGYTSLAGHCFAAAAESNGRTLVAVLLKCKDRKEMFKDTIKLFEAAFNQPMLERTVLEAGPLPFNAKVEGASKTVQAFLPDRLTVKYYPAEEPQLAASLHWYELAIPVLKGQRIGEIVLATPEGRTIQTAPVFAAADVKASPFNNLWQAIKGLGIFGWLAVLACLGFVFWMIRR
ncbi:MAG: D-alanyl-D-alanine carboxypeptidase [Nitrosomonas sp.]|nr:MAG: D-alanyl-D-alanine carboxypeptidase [Nitrosomonas sp.]